MNMRTLDRIPCGESVTVIGFRGAGVLRQRLMEMGLTKGSRVSVARVAPLGDPIEINVRGYGLSLRKSDAEMIEVE